MNHSLFFINVTWFDKKVEGYTILTMEQYTIQQCIYVMQTYYENRRSLKNTFRKICDYFGVSNRPLRILFAI